MNDKKTPTAESTETEIVDIPAPADPLAMQTNAKYFIDQCARAGGKKTLDKFTVDSEIDRILNWPIL